MGGGGEDYWRSNEKQESEMTNETCIGYSDDPVLSMRTIELRQKLLQYTTKLGYKTWS